MNEDQTACTAPDVGILGGGIAGLTAGVAMRRAGIQCTVYEQAERLGEVGVGIQLTPNATRQLELLGLAEPLRAMAVRPASLDLLRWQDGRLLARMPLGAECVALFGAPYYSLHRADLHRILCDALPPDAIALNHRCVDVQVGGDSVDVTFAHGAPRRIGLALCADGMHSVARRALSSDAPRSSGQFAFRGLVPADRLPDFSADPRVRAWFGPEQHCVCYPVSGGDWISFTAMVPADAARSDTCSEEDSLETLAEAYLHWDPALLTMFGSAESIGRWELCDRDPLRRWTTGRLALLGDAAHPMLPFRAQGANQAIEDAVVLVDCLRMAGSDVPGALRRYERIRLPRATEIQRGSRNSSNTFHLGDGDRQLVRDQSMPEQWTLDSQRWTFGYRADLVASQP
ncbi:MAG: NAD(P)-binding protein [Pseudonocardiaceae bacterium]|nr:NAD(P)-binding protein [Pseudonocardiaceae bacterium]